MEAVREMACTVLEHGVNLVLLSIGAFADAAFYGQVKDAARRGCAKVHLANGAIGGFDVLQTITLMAQAGKLDETAGIETHTGARGFRNTPVWAEHLLTDTEKTTVFTGSAKVEFRGNGEWKEVDCRYAAVPAGIVPAPINAKVQELYPGAVVVGIDRDKRDTEVKLNNRMELTFDRNYLLMDIDD